MNITELGVRANNKLRRLLAENFARRSYVLRGVCPYISFTFDDFPHSAFVEGGRILRKYGAFGTYYVAMRLIGQLTEVGLIASREDLRALVEEGHEVGCHTFGHLDGTVASPEAFADSIEANRVAFRQVAPNSRLTSFAYPFNGPRLAVKRVVREHFVCCRGGGQTFNQGVIDLALLKAYFIDWRNATDGDAIATLIVRNRAARGWLIFATHDITKEPSNFGCQPEFFEAVVRLAVESGAKVLPVREVCQELGASPTIA
jgi:peptidoglycan/xylan/chitin deacetylase (PgdA/CDA1 family)